MRYDHVKSRHRFDIVDAAEIWPRADAAGWAPLAEIEAALAKPRPGQEKAQS